jgi:hypothetical protein
MPAMAVIGHRRHGRVHRRLMPWRQTPVRRDLMLISDKVARTKWCPFVRIDNNNRLHNSLTDGFENSEKMYHCIGNDCMGWRQFHLSHYKGSEENVQGHGYCGFAGKIELE